MAGNPHITRRAAFVGIGATVTGLANADTANAKEAEHPWVKARRLARELSETLNDCDDGTQMMEVYPSKRRSFMIVDMAYLGETARERLEYHGKQFARAARDIDPAATECFLGEAIDKDLSSRFSVIVSRKFST